MKWNIAAHAAITTDNISQGDIVYSKMLFSGRFGGRVVLVIYHNIIHIQIQFIIVSPKYSFYRNQRLLGEQ